MKTRKTFFLLSVLCLCMMVLCACNTEDPAETPIDDTPVIIPKPVFTQITNLSAYKGLYLGINEQKVYEAVITETSMTVGGEDETLYTSDKDSLIYSKNDDETFDEVTIGEDTIVFENITFTKATLDYAYNGCYLAEIVFKMSSLDFSYVTSLDIENGNLDKFAPGSLYRAGEKYFFKFHIESKVGYSQFISDGYFIFNFNEKGDEIDAEMLADSQYGGNASTSSAHLKYTKLTPISEYDSGLPEGIYSSKNTEGKKIKVTATGMEIENTQTGLFEPATIGTSKCYVHELIPYSYVLTDEIPEEKLYITLPGKLSDELIVSQNSFKVGKTEYVPVTED